ncbi:MAG: DNA-binding response regulator [Nitrospirota bacterium]
MKSRRILIIDEHGFSRVCSAILESEGYDVEVVNNISNRLKTKIRDNDFGLIVISYPYGALLLDEIRKFNISNIVLSDNIDEKLISRLRGFYNSYCMIKPLDYSKFKSLVKQVMSGDMELQRGYNIV